MATLLNGDYMLDRHRDTPHVTTVWGPYDVDYGRQNYGRVERRDGRYVAVGSDNRDIGAFRRRQDAVDSVIEWGRENLTSESVRRDFENVTAGGVRVEFCRRVFTHRGPRIVAIYNDGGRRVQATWRGDGNFGEFEPSSVEEAERYAKLTLVPKRPAATLEADQERPAPSFGR